MSLMIVKSCFDGYAGLIIDADQRAVSVVDGYFMMEE
jgi:hypothetical protein